MDFRTISNMTRHIPDVYLQDRLVLDLGVFGVPGAIKLGRVNYRKAHAPLNEHVHPGALEICFLACGRQTYSTREREYRLTSDDVFVSFPGERHSTGGRPEEKSILYFLILSTVPQARGFLGYPGREGRRLREALLALPRRHFAGDAHLKAPLDAILRDIRPDDPFASLRLRLHLADFLLRILAFAAHPQAWDVSPAMQKVMDVIRERPGDEQPLEALGRLAGVSLSHFKARFRQEVGLPPSDFIRRERMVQARKLLEEGRRSVTEIAFELGFSSSQYFSTVFKRYTGRNPREFKR